MVQYKHQPGGRLPFYLAVTILYCHVESDTAYQDLPERFDHMIITANHD